MYTHGQIARIHDNGRIVYIGHQVLRAPPEGGILGSGKSEISAAASLRTVTVLWLAQGHVNADGSSAEDVEEWAVRTQAEAAVEGAQAAVERGDKVLLLSVALTPNHLARDVRLGQVRWQDVLCRVLRRAWRRQRICSTRPWTLLWTCNWTGRIAQTTTAVTPKVSPPCLFGLHFQSAFIFYESFCEHSSQLGHGASRTAGGPGDVTVEHRDAREHCSTGERQDSSMCALNR